MFTRGVRRVYRAPFRPFTATNSAVTSLWTATHHATHQQAHQSTRHRPWRLQVREFTAATEPFEPSFNPGTRMWTRQDELPKLPIPELDDTCRRYLEMVAPLLNDEEMADAKAIIERFLEVDGVLLQAKLRELDETLPHSSYVADFWDHMYLSGRYPVPINSNPQFCFTDDLDYTHPQLERAASLVIGSLPIVSDVRTGNLEPDTEGKNIPLCMTQCERLFGTTRIPHEDVDELRTSHDSRHIVVIRNKEFYSVDVVQEDGSPVPDETIVSQLKAILNAHEEWNDDPCVGVLTTCERDEWAKIRAKMETNDVNRATLEVIDSAIYVLCLDWEGPTSMKDTAHALLHGDGEGRWFDKSLQLIVCRNGKSGVNFEHSWGDGHTVGVSMIRLDELAKAVDVASLVDKADEECTVEPLKWAKLPSSTLSDKTNEFKEAYENVDIRVLNFKTFGANSIKEYGVGPDSFAQMSIQLAFHKLHGYTPSTYESCSTKNYRKAGMKKKQLATRLRDACAKHREIAKSCKIGEGVDRHLFALRCLAAEEGKDVELFNSISFHKFSHITLSTSSVNAPINDFVGFGAVTHDGYGVGYVIHPDRMVFNVSCYHDHELTDSLAFTGALEEALSRNMALLAVKTGK